MGHMQMDDLIEMDAEKCRAIVASARVYIHFCYQAGKPPSFDHVENIIYMRDKATNAMYEASQIGADDDYQETG